MKMQWMVPWLGGLLAACSRSPEPARPALRLQAVAPALPATAPAKAERPPPDWCSARTAQPELAVPALEDGPGPSAHNLDQWVRVLAAPALRGRRAGSPDAARAARLVARYFRALGLSAPDGDFCSAYDLNGSRDQNVVAHRAPSPGCPWLIVGAHYDGQGVDENGVVYPSADDNASGVAVLLELARLVSHGGGPGLALIAFGGEEQDLAGSRAYASNPSIPFSQVALMVNVDMAGRRPRGFPVIGFETYGSSRWATARQVRRAAAGAKVSAIPMRLGDRSDSASFADHVPTVFLCTTVHEDYHRPTDTADRVDVGQVERSLKLVLGLLEQQSCVPEAGSRQSHSTARP
jgi:hypothetical protein